MTTNRSKPLYPTEGPGDGRDWHEFFEAIHVPRTAPDDDVPDDDDLAGAITVVQPAREVGDGEPVPRVISTWRNRLLANDWTFKVGCSMAHHDDTYYLNGNLKAAAHDEEQWWINARNGNVYITISYNRVGGLTKSTRTVLQVRGRLRNLSDKEMQEFIES